ncbi:MAG: hypothetical protein ABJI96_08280 [Paracoccaceae bacterium]
MALNFEGIGQACLVIISVDLAVLLAVRAISVVYWEGGNPRCLEMSLTALKYVGTTVILMKVAGI